MWILAGAIVIGIGMWLILNRTALGMLIRAGVDDREMLAASGVRIHLVFLAVFGFGAGLAGAAGIVGGTFQSLSPGEDTRFLLASLVVVIVGGMGSIAGAALGALIIGITEQFGLVYAPTYSVVFTFLIMAAVLAFGRKASSDRGGRRWRSSITPRCPVAAPTIGAGSSVCRRAGGSLRWCCCSCRSWRTASGCSR